MANAIFNQEVGFYFADPNEAQKWIRTCLGALPLVLFKDFNGLIISAMTAVLAKEVNGEHPYDSKLFMSLQRNLEPAKDKKDGTKPSITRPSNMRLLAYWLMQSSHERRLPDSWLRAIEAQPRFHSVIAWDRCTQQVTLPFPQQYTQQMSLMWPTEEDVAKMDPVSRAFRASVLGIQVTEASSRLGMAYTFPVDINLSPSRLKEHFAKTIQKPQPEITNVTSIASLLAPLQEPVVQSSGPYQLLPVEGGSEEPLTKKPKDDQTAGYGGSESSTIRDEPVPPTTDAQAKPAGDEAAQPAWGSDSPLSSTLEDLHVYLAKQDELIQNLERRCGVAEAIAEALTHDLRRRRGAVTMNETRIQELERRFGNAEEATRTRVDELQQQVDELTAKLAAPKQEHVEAPASAPGLANFLKRKRGRSDERVVYGSESECERTGSLFHPWKLAGSRGY